jgi:hypothetical protein
MLVRDPVDHLNGNLKKLMDVVFYLFIYLFIYFVMGCFVCEHVLYFTCYMYRQSVKYRRDRMRTFKVS